MVLVQRLTSAVAPLARSLRIWWLALRLLTGLWWDGQSWTYPGGVNPSRRAARQRRRARWLTQQ